MSTMMKESEMNVMLKAMHKILVMNMQLLKGQIRKGSIYPSIDRSTSKSWYINPCSTMHFF